MLKMIFHVNIKHGLHTTLKVWLAGVVTNFRLHRPALFIKINHVLCFHLVFYSFLKLQRFFQQLADASSQC